MVLDTFFSTSSDRDVVLSWFDPSLRRDSPQQNVLFEIDVNTMRGIKSRPYADIEHLTTKKDEKEFLFMPGVQFRIYDVLYDENIQCWIVQMLLISNDDKDILLMNERKCTRKKLKYLFNALFYDRKVRIPSGERESMFTHFDDMLAPCDKIWANIVSLHLEALKGRTLAQSNYIQALAMWSDFMTNDDSSKELNCFIDISQLHKDFAHYYEISDDYDTSEKHLNQANDSLQEALQHASIDTERIIIEDELADLYNAKLCENDEKSREDFSRVIELKERSLQYSRNFNSANDDAIVPRLKELAYLYQSIDEYDVALGYFQESLDIHLQKDKPYRTSIINICDNMVSIYMEKKHDAKSAFSYQLISHQQCLKQGNMNCELQSLNEDYLTENNELAASYVILGDIYTKLNQYDLARENLTTASKLYTYYNRNDKDVNLGDTEEKLAIIFEALHQYNLVHRHLMAALQLFQKRKQSLIYRRSFNIQNADEKDSLCHVIESAFSYSLGAEKITEKIVVIEGKLKKMKRLLKNN